MAETRETQVLEDVIDSTEIENPRTTEEAILAQVIAGEEVTINPRTRLQTYLSQLTSGGGGATYEYSDWVTINRDENCKSLYDFAHAHDPKEGWVVFAIFESGDKKVRPLDYIYRRTGNSSGGTCYLKLYWGSSGSAARPGFNPFFEFDINTYAITSITSGFEEKKVRFAAYQLVVD